MADFDTVGDQCVSTHRSCAASDNRAQQLPPEKVIQIWQIASTFANMPSLKFHWRSQKSKLKLYSIPRLPTELYLHIFEQVEDRKDLYNLLFVSRNFHAEAERVLYRSIRIKGPKLPAHLQLFARIASCERTARYIQSLFISTGPSLFEASSIDADTFWEVLHDALCATSNLKRLYLLATEETWPYYAFPAFLGCTFQLRTLVLHAMRRPTIILDSTFLDRQSELIELDIRHILELFLPENVFPKLTTLTVSCPSSARFINQPSLRAVHLPDPTDLINPWMVSRYVTSLRLPYTNPHDEFERIINIFPCLRYLRIDDLHQPSAIAPLWLPTALEKLSLHFSAKLELRDKLQLRKYVFRHSDSLRVVIIEEGPISAKGTCAQWIRGVNGQEIVERNEEEWQEKCWH